jgi:aminopeptidase N
MGAMENPGLVTFNDNYLYPDKVSTETMLSFANTIAHECSHMWFGDLVTMKWWDDLWLNESFADFISHFFLEKKAKGGLKSINY